MAIGFTVDKVRNLMRTRPGEAVFWSGTTYFSRPQGFSKEQYRAEIVDTGGQDRAKVYASCHDGKTLEMLMEENRDALIEAGFPYDEEKKEFVYSDGSPNPDGSPSKWGDTRLYWDQLSDAFAEGASGQVRVLFGMDGNTLREDADGNIHSYESTWQRAELSRIKRNPNITGVTALDPYTLEEIESFTPSEIVISTEYLNVDPEEKKGNQADSHAVQIKENGLSDEFSTDGQSIDKEKKRKGFSGFSLVSFLLTVWFIIALFLSIKISNGDQHNFLTQSLAVLGGIASVILELRLLKKFKVDIESRKWFWIFLILFSFDFLVLPIFLNKILWFGIMLYIGWLLLSFFLHVGPSVSSVRVTRTDAEGRSVTKTEYFTGDVDTAVRKAENQLKSEGYDNIKSWKE